MQPESSTNANTEPKAVLPFYGFAALSFLAATILLSLSSINSDSFYFTPEILTIVHIMALGWGTMMILGSGYQLIPVLNESRLYSERLAFYSFFPAATGIISLCYGFYRFDMGLPAQAGALLINIAVLMFLVNIIRTIRIVKTENIQMVFLFTAAIWLFFTSFSGALLVFNFTMDILPKDSLYYLSLHAHLGMVGWFLLIVVGVGSKLIPMFMISGYENNKLLWAIYLLINAGLIVFTLEFFSETDRQFFLIPITLVLMALGAFIYFCRQAYGQRLRKKLDEQMKLSFFSILLISLPLLLLFIVLIWSVIRPIQNKFYLIYGFIVFFGWLTALILGMSFKTLPFIIWNMHSRKKTDLPVPRTLFSKTWFSLMQWSYIFGFLLFIAGLFFSIDTFVVTGSLGLLTASLLYNLNIYKMFFFKPPA